MPCYVLYHFFRFYQSNRYIYITDFRYHKVTASKVLSTRSEAEKLAVLGISSRPQGEMSDENTSSKAAVSEVEENIMFPKEKSSKKRKRKT